MFPSFQSGFSKFLRGIPFLRPPSFSPADHRIWQDVYYVPSEAGTLYVKFTADAVTGFLLLSFKGKEDD